MKECHLEICKKEIKNLLKKKLISKIKSPWSCPEFYKKNTNELEQGVPKLVINYKLLNKVLRWIRCPIPNKKDLLNCLYKVIVFFKFDLKSGYWQILIKKDRYNTTFPLSVGHYEWNVMRFGLKNAPSKFEKIMNEIFNPYVF